MYVSSREKHSKVPYIRYFLVCQPNRAYTFGDSTLKLKVLCVQYFICRHVHLKSTSKSMKLPYARYFEFKITICFHIGFSNLFLQLLYVQYFVYELTISKGLEQSVYSFYSFSLWSHSRSSFQTFGHMLFRISTITYVPETQRRAAAVIINAFKPLLNSLLIRLAFFQKILV